MLTDHLVYFPSLTRLTANSSDLERIEEERIDERGLFRENGGTIEWRRGILSTVVLNEN